jgi:hypothetical protein
MLSSMSRVRSAQIHARQSIRRRAAHLKFANVVRDVDGSHIYVRREVHRAGAAPVTTLVHAAMADNSRRRSLGLLGNNALQNALSAFVPPKLAGSGATPPAHAQAPPQEGLVLAAQKPPRPNRRASCSFVRCGLKGTLQLREGPATYRALSDAP